MSPISMINEKMESVAVHEPRDTESLKLSTLHCSLPHLLFIIVQVDITPHAHIYLNDFFTWGSLTILSS